MPTEIASDTFNDTDEVALATHNANWTIETGALKIISNALISNGGGSGRNIASYGVTFHANHYVEFDPISTGDSGAKEMLGFVRLVGTSGYMLEISGAGTDDIIIRRLDSNTPTTLVSTTGWTNGDTFRLEIKGSVLTAFQNGIQILQAVDPTYADGTPGVGIDGDQHVAATIDNWSGGNLSLEIASDSFTAGDGTALTAHNALWVNFLAAPEIQSNAASNNVTGIGLVGWNATFSNDQYSEVVATLTGNVGSVMGPMVRLSDIAGGGDGYVWITDGGGQSELFRIDNGSASGLTANDADNPVTGDTMRIEIRGSRITCKLNGVQVMTFVDTNYPSGDSGIGFSGNTEAQRALSWSGGDLDEMKMIIMPEPSWT